MKCACCGDVISQEQQDIHRLMAAIEKALTDEAVLLKSERGLEGVDANIAIEALLSVTAGMIDRLYKGERRSLEMKGCESFFRNQHVN